MPNPFFRFKQFTVFQNHCAMKVCTDACLFGAWVVHHMQAHNTPLMADLPQMPGDLSPDPGIHRAAVRHILDIGTGTGLLSLMTAQGIPEAAIDAVEIDREAAKQAGENFTGSPWQQRMQVYHMPVQKFANTSPALYDLIITNPPFFENDLKSSDAQRNLALHSEALSLEELFRVADQLLGPTGKMAVLLPSRRVTDFTTLAASFGFSIAVTAEVQQTPLHPFFRCMFIADRQPALCLPPQTIVIRDETNQYTPEFASLLAPYYLYL